jgi:two-component system, OmpR family, response regulator AdeR
MTNGMKPVSASGLLAGKKILIAEDELELAEILEAFLEREGALVLKVSDGVTAIEQSLAWQPDLLLLDIRMPKRDGLSVLVAQREHNPDIPVMMISALGDDIDRLSGFRLGADDYIVKPFNPLEVVARAAAVLRRQQAANTHKHAAPVAVLGNLKVEIDNRRAFISEKLLNLTPTEFRIIAILIRRPGRLYTRSELTEQVLSDDASDRGIDAHVSRLRAKIAAATNIQITSVRGEGYRLEIMP